MCDTRREGEEWKLSAEFWGSFESSLHNQPSFQVNSELSHSGLFQTTASEREMQHTHSSARTHMHKGDVLKNDSSAPVHPVNLGTSSDNLHFIKKKRELILISFCE